MPKVTKTAIHELASPEVGERGEDYYESGAVLTLIRRGKQLQAEVQGSDYEPYRVTVVLGSRGGVDRYGCTCPYDWGGACKHVVATLLAFQHDPQQIEERPPLESLLSDLEAGQLRQVLVNLAGSLPAATEAIEAEVAELRRKPPKARRGAKRKGTPRRPRPPNPTTVRRQVRTALHSLEGMRRSEAYWHVPEVVARVRAVAEKIGGFLEAREVRAALAALDALTGEYSDGWTTLDDSDGAASGFFGDLHSLWTEAMVVADPGLTDTERAIWATRLAGWQRKLRDDDLDDVFDEPRAILLGQWQHPARLEEVVETYGSAYPEWALKACQQQAQRLLAQAKPKDYDEAVRWLAMGRAAAMAAGRLEAWQADLDEMIARHARKPRLVTLLRKLRRRRSRR